MSEKVVEKSEKELNIEEVNEGLKKITSINDKVKAIALNSILDKKKDLDEQLEKEIRALTLKYDELSQPLYDASSDIITGKRTVTSEELSKAKDILTEDEQKQLEQAQANTEPISEYWLKALQNSDLIGAEIKEKDVPILKHVTNITYTPNKEDQLQFSITFYFSENEFFSNQTLTKHFILKDDDEPKEGKGTEIQWKDGKDVTVKQIKKTQKNKKSGQKRVVTKEVPDESFFNFFKDHAMTEEEPEEDDEEGLQDNDMLLIDFDIARSLVDEVIPYSLEYYLGVRRQEDYEDYGQYGDEQDDDDDDEDAEAIEQEQKKSKKKAHKKSSDSTKSNEGKQEKPECKQQ